MALHPVGPLPASTYWRRRVVLLLGVLVMLLVGRSCVSGGGSPAPRPTPTPTPSRSALPTATPTATAAALPLCPDASLTLSASTDADTYALGATPKITLVVKNTGTTGCRRDIGAGAVELLVFSGNDRVWSSDDCNPSTAKALVSLPPGGTQAIVKTWPGRRSLPGCAGSKDGASPGTYRVVARVGTLRQDGAVFRLHA